MSRRVEELRSIHKEGFLAMFGSIYEHSEWVAEQLWAEKAALFSVDERLLERIQQAMVLIVDNSSSEQKLTLLRAHPDLAGKAALAGELTAESTSEQADAGLDQCSENELKEFHQLNHEYKAKFEFPFIMAVKGANKYKILQGFKTRINNTREQEFVTAINEVHKIAAFRLEALLS